MSPNLPHPRDLAAALSLLTRLPLAPGWVDPTRMASAAWGWPLVGALIGALAGGVGALALWAGLPAAAAAGLVLAAQMMLTGGLHEDGLADTADGLWGGGAPQRRLEIMKDSRIGSYGVLALILVTGLRWAALTALAGADLWLALIAAGALSRTPMAVMARALPQARPGGLSAATGPPPASAVLLAVAVAIAIGLAALGVAFWVPVAAALLVTIWLARQAQAKIGGQTGDILGASQQLAEVAVLLALTAS